jgi:hypothetical protein
MVNDPDPQSGVSMRRTSLVLAGAIACVLLSFAGTAAAKPTTKTCTTNSRNVIGHTVTGTITASNVNSVQARYATCGYVKKVMDSLLSLRIEEPKLVKAFRCTPTVLSTEPDVVKYRCVFKGADTPMLVRVGFKVEYDQD